MRLRKIKGALETLQNDSKYMVNKPIEMRGKWHTLFNNENPISIEIGCGKGKFIIGMAKLFPNINFIGIEKFDSVMLRTLQACSLENLSNVKLILLDALELETVFENSEVDDIFLNFSDPWPKAKHAKRRLTSDLYLECYEKILNSKGSIIQKTDNRGLFEFSLESFSQNGWYISNISLDLHQNEPEDNIRTEFEEKWAIHGPIYKLIAKKEKKEKKK